MTAPTSVDASGMAKDASTLAGAGRLAAATAGSLGSSGSCATSASCTAGDAAAGTCRA